MFICIHPHMWIQHKYVFTPCSLESTWKYQRGGVHEAKVTRPAGPMTDGKRTTAGIMSGPSVEGRPAALGLRLLAE